MNLGDLVFLAVATYSVCFGIIESPLPIISNIRNFLKERFENTFIEDLLTCYHCLGFWVGLFLSVFFLFIFNPVKAIGLALYSAGAALILSNIVEYLFSQYNKGGENHAE